MAKGWTRREEVNSKCKYRYYKMYTCPQCGKEFEGRADLKRTYCSKECHNKAMTKEGEKINNNHVYNLKCKLCGKDFKAFRYDQPYCSYKCSGIAHRGKNNSMYKTGTYDHEGYIQELKSEGGYKFIHRRVIEEILGRELQSSEHIHHIDGDTKNNEINNLVILTCSEHSRIHQYLRGNGKMTEEEYLYIIETGRKRIANG